MNTLAAVFYPTQSRASGVSWMLGIGRFGGILGAMGGGWLLGAGWDISRIFMTLAVPTPLAGLALAFKCLRYREVHEVAVGRRRWRALTDPHSKGTHHDQDTNPSRHRRRRPGRAAAARIRSSGPIVWASPAVGAIQFHKSRLKSNFFLSFCFLMQI